MPSFTSSQMHFKLAVINPKILHNCMAFLCRAVTATAVILPAVLHIHKNSFFLMECDVLNCL